MTDYLGVLAARALGRTEGIAPRRASLFETDSPAAEVQPGLQGLEMDAEHWQAALPGEHEPSRPAVQPDHRSRSGPPELNAEVAGDMLSPAQDEGSEDVQPDHRPRSQPPELNAEVAGDMLSPAQDEGSEDAQPEASGRRPARSATSREIRAGDSQPGEGRAGQLDPRRPLAAATRRASELSETSGPPDRLESAGAEAVAGLRFRIDIPKDEPRPAFALPSTRHAPLQLPGDRHDETRGRRPGLATIRHEAGGLRRAAAATEGQAEDGMPIEANLEARHAAFTAAAESTFLESEHSFVAQARVAPARQDLVGPPGRTRARGSVRQSPRQPAPPPDIHISIGRVEVRATPPPASVAPAKPRSGPQLTLEAYMRQRNGDR